MKTSRWAWLWFALAALALAVAQGWNVSLALELEQRSLEARLFWVRESKITSAAAVLDCELAHALGSLEAAVELGWPERPVDNMPLLRRLELPKDAAPEGELAELAARAGPGLEASFLRTETGEQALWLTRRGADGLFCAEVDWAQLREVLLGKAREQLRGENFTGMRLSLGPIERMPPTPSTTAVKRNDAPLSSLPLMLVADGLAPAAVPAWSPNRQMLLYSSVALLAGLWIAAWALARALELSRRRGAFASAVTHELRTPLTTFVLYSELLADGRIQDPGEKQQALDTLKREAQRLRRIVENVLDWARVERAPRAPEALRAQCLTVEALLSELLPALEARALAGGLRLVFERAPQLQGELQLDPQVVEQVLANLIDNACKYAASGKRVELLATTEGEELVLRVRDFGPGISASERRAIFEPFHRGGGEGALVTPGLGLGLALARGLARGLGGELTLEDHAPGGGACFALRVPLL